MWCLLQSQCHGYLFVSLISSTQSSGNSISSLLCSFLSSHVCMIKNSFARGWERGLDKADWVMVQKQSKASERERILEEEKKGGGLEHRVWPSPSTPLLSRLRSRQGPTPEPECPLRASVALLAPPDHWTAGACYAYRDMVNSDTDSFQK